MLVPVKKILQKGDQLRVQALDCIPDLAAVVIGKDQGVDGHAHGKTDGRVPEPADGVGDGGSGGHTQIGLCRHGKVR